MPIYEYECKECGEESEMLVRSSEEQVVCPSCGSSAMEKGFSTFAVSMSKSSSKGACAEGGCGMSPDSPCAGGGCPF
ncbi:MAG: zinc ribbon domain-containing protein [Candidatus Latescibacterota bacterium]